VLLLLSLPQACLLSSSSSAAAAARHPCPLHPPAGQYLLVQF
jgi:hypothetical protein